MRIGRVVKGVGFLLASATASFAQSGPEGDHHVVASPAPSQAKMLATYTVPTPGGYEPGPGDAGVWRLQSRVNEVRELWRKADIKSEANRNAVRNAALEAAQHLEGVPDETLRLGGLIVKNEYACFGFVMAAANDQSKEMRLSLATKAEKHCRLAASQIATVINGSQGDTSALAVREWAIRSDERPRVAYLTAMSKCLQAKSSGDKALSLEARTILSSEVPGNYSSRYPPKSDYVLSQCVNE